MSTSSPSKGLSVALWIAQTALAAMFGMTGTMKLFQPIEALVTMLPWVASMPAALVRFIGTSEFLGAIGILFPSLLRRWPQLSVLAAVGLALVQTLAALFHLSRGEYSGIGMNVVLAATAVFIAWGRASRARINTR